jgi:Nucleotidyltransferase domain
VIADWAAPAPSATIYVYGSRVRGDHRSDSDVDLHVAMPSMPEREFVEWWTAENGKDFAELRAKLPGRLEILDPRDPLGGVVENAKWFTAIGTRFVSGDNRNRFANKTAIDEGCRLVAGTAFGLGPLRWQRG